VSAVQTLARLVEREMEFWGKPIVAMLIGIVPIALIDLFFGGAPSAAPGKILYPVLGVIGIWESFVIWLYVKFEIKLWRELRALDAAEEEAAKRHG
jgi:uncharacterized membrane protein YuzA (DUF378 family)